MAVESITMLSLTGSVVGYMTILPSQGTGKHDCIIVVIAIIAAHSIIIFFIVLLCLLFVFGLLFHLCSFTAHTCNLLLQGCKMTANICVAVSPVCGVPLL